MQKLFQGSTDLAARHELDGLLPTSAVKVDLATHRQLPDLVAIARREIPGVNGAIRNRFLLLNVRRARWVE